MDRAAQLAINAASYLAGAEVSLPTAKDVLASAVDDDTRQIAALAMMSLTRAHVIAFDLSALEKTLRLARSLEDPSSHACGHAWIAWMQGDASAASRHAEEFGEIARHNAWAAETIEATTLRALAATLDGPGEEGTRLARRASRMARTESLPQTEYLANIALSRVRRMEGKAHLSMRILSALMRVAPRPWHGWMRWELVLAGHLDEDADTPSGLLSRGLSALEAGNRDAFNAALKAVEERVQGAAAIVRELAAYRALLDLSRQADSVADFRGGRQVAVPLGLGAACLVGAHASHVVAQPGVAARRVAARGLPLLDSFHRLASAPGRQARTESAIAQLLLCGPEGESEESLFSALYAFAYVPSRHRGVRDVLYHRVRERCGDHATLVRLDGTVHLEVHTMLVVPDPRCSLRPEHALLQTLAQGVATPAEASKALGLPLRTVQDALKRLAKDGACQMRKKGRKVEYEIEDTTFLEPTGVPARKR